MPGSGSGKAQRKQALSFQGSASAQARHRSRPSAPLSPHNRQRGENTVRAAFRSHPSTFRASMRLTALLPVFRLPGL
jgi:hypothetical protein